MFTLSIHVQQDYCIPRTKLAGYYGFASVTLSPRPQDFIVNALQCAFLDQFSSNLVCAHSMARAQNLPILVAI